MYFLVIPYILFVVGIPGIMAIPFYFFNKYLHQKISPRAGGKNLLIYFLVLIICLVVYITLGIFLIIWVAKFLQ